MYIEAFYRPSSEPDIKGSRDRTKRRERFCISPISVSAEPAPMLDNTDLRYHLSRLNQNPQGSAMAWWLMHLTPDPEVGVRAPLGLNHVVSLSKAHLLPKVLVIPGKQWLRPNMTEKWFIWTLRINQPINQPKWRSTSPAVCCRSWA